MMLEPDIIKEISELGIFVISDEIYHGLVYEGQEKTILEYSKKSIVVNGFSKLFSMTGWRLGYLIVPEEFVRPIQKLQQNLFISANSFVQRAAIKALNIKKQKLDSIVGSYKKRRDLMLNGLNNLGFNIRLVPDGAFYIFANSYHINKNSYKLAFDILERSHVALTPGIDFGSGGEGYIRKGELLTIYATELISRVLQHEIDHLDGILFIDRLSRLRRELIKKKVNRAFPKKRS